jgi:hypothetical protein
MKITFFDASGRQVDASIATDERGVIKHGFRIRTSMLMMDSETRDPFVPLTDEQKIADIEARNARLSDAWRNPQAAVHQEVAPVVPGATLDMDEVYERHDRRLQDAWKRTAL